MKLTASERCTRPRALLCVAPDLLTYEDEGYVTVRGQIIDVPAEQFAAAQEAANCRTGDRAPGGLNTCPGAEFGTQDGGE